ncbi:SDR family NAD(P)-dependent oxidoreductase [Nocardiopsis alba]|uniref:SDR family NAD(P)-dependent oxidoreductase n=1 Tax=Nocardiopsis alba TaxID=53437 RepID=UPI00339E269A
MRGLKTTLTLAGARWLWRRHRRSRESTPVSAGRSGAELLAWGAAAAALGAGASALSERRRARRMNGRVVLVTGGSRGLGLQLAREFGAGGASVVICARGREDLDRAVAELTGRGVEALGVVCDVTDPEAVDSLLDDAVDRFGRLDVVVNSAGIMRVGPQRTLPDDAFVQAMDVMFWGPFHLSRAVMERMRGRGGTIVNITSIGAYLSVPHLLPYSAAKHAWAALSEGMAAESGGSGVRVVTVVPGLMRTGSHRGVVFSGNPEREYAWFALAAGAPLLSVSAERAARRIVAAAASGRGFLVISPIARIGLAVHGVAPGLTQAGMRLVGRLLPDAPEHVEERSGSEAADSRIGRLVGVVAALNERAGRRMNQSSRAEERRRDVDSGKDG